MSEVPICRIVLSSQLPSYDVESLETALEMASIKIHKQPNRAIGIDDLVVITTVISGVTATARLVEYGVKVALRNQPMAKRTKKKKGYTQMVG